MNAMLRASALCRAYPARARPALSVVGPSLLPRARKNGAVQRHENFVKDDCSEPPLPAWQPSWVPAAPAAKKTTQKQASKLGVAATAWEAGFIIMTEQDMGNLADLVAQVINATQTTDENPNLALIQQLNKQYYATGVEGDTATKPSSTDAAFPASSSSSGVSGSGLAPVWMYPSELQQLAANTPRSEACCGTAERNTVSWHPSKTMTTPWAAAAPKKQTAPQAHAVEVDIASVPDGRPPRFVLIDPLASEVMDVAAAEVGAEDAVASLRAEVDMQYKTIRGLREEQWMQDCRRRQEKAQLLAHINQLEAALATANVSAAGSPATASAAAPAPAVPTARTATQQAPVAAGAVKQCSVHFSITCPTEYGQRVWLVGDDASLGSWDMASAQKLRWTEGDKWQGSACLVAPGGSSISYKAVLEHAPGRYRWCSGDNFKLKLTQTHHKVAHKFE